MAAAVAGAALVSVVAVSASGRTTPSLGTPPHVEVGDAAGFAAPHVGPGTPMCPSASLGHIVCYSPAFIRQAYDFPTGPNAPTGSGQTIVIFEAYGSPTIEADLSHFDAAFGIPPPPVFTEIDAAGTGATGSGDTLSWGVETSLDVEYAHAMAPGAAIVLGVAATDDIDDITAAEQQIVPQYPGAIVSQSFGDDETDTSAFSDFRALHKVFVTATRAGGTLIASTGDFGATDGNDNVTAAYPASDPLVLAIGGTQGKPYPAGLWKAPGRYGSEATWNEGDVFDLATGGAPSIFFRAPAWQRGLTDSRTRTVPDVAYNAAIDGGVLVYYTTHVFTVGGTSAGPPQWAAILALAGELRARAHTDSLGFANDNLYRIAQSRDGRNDFHDIKDGNNALDSDLGFKARPGFDVPTGLGTPDVANLISDLALAPAGNPSFDDLDPSLGGPRGHGPGHGRPHAVLPGQ